jgi:DNA-binding CsgD family transcriptional regulator
MRPSAGAGSPEAQRKTGEPVERTRLLERDRDLKEISDGVARAHGGEGATVLVEGPAGSGKSALLAAALTRAAGTDALILRAVGAELERGHAFGAVRQLFEPVLARERAREPRALLQGVAAPLAWLIEPGGDPGSLATRAQAGPALLQAVHALVGRLAARGPLVIAVDDLHWLDDPSLLALAFVARRLAGLPVAILGTLRPSEPGAPARLLDDLRGVPGVCRISLAPLSAEAVSTLVRERVPGATPGLCAAYHRTSGGNPLHLRELLLWARGEGLGAEPAAEAAVAAASIPALADRLERRLGRVSPQAHALAAAMSVLGDGQPLRDAAALAGISERDAARIARAFTDIELLRYDDPFAFAHPLQRRSLYDRLSAAERQALHQAAADRLEARGAGAELIASHVSRLAPSGSSVVAAALRAGAAAASAQAAPGLAKPLLQRALEEGAAEPSRAALLFDLGQAEGYTSDPSAFAHLEEAFALAAGDPRLRAQIGAVLAYMMSASGRWTTGLEVTALALSELSAGDTELRAELESLRAAMMAHDPNLIGEFDQERERFEELSRGTSWPSLAIAALLASLAANRCRPPDEVRALADRALRGGRLLRERGGGAWASGQILPALVEIEEHDRVLELAAALVTRGQESGSLLATTTGIGMRGCVNTRRGDLAAAEADLRQVHQLVSESGMEMWLTSMMHVFCEALLERSSLNDFGAMVESAQVDPVFATTGGGVMLLETRGRLALTRNDPDRAVDDLEACLRTCERLGSGPPHTWCRSALALALPPSQRSRARALVEEELALARTSGLPRGIGVGLRTAGLLSRGGEVVALLRESVATLATSPARLEHARSLVELGAALRRQRKRGEAREHLVTGMDLAHQCGADRLVARADQELHAAGARPRRAPRSGAGALTPSERRVAWLAASGKSNAEIARELYLSPKTIESHLSATYRKLGLGGRAARAGLSDMLLASDPTDG